MNPVSAEATAVPAVERELVPGQRQAGGADEAPPVVLLGPLPCINCGARVLWVRDGNWILRDEDGVKHRCAA